MLYKVYMKLDNVNYLYGKYKTREKAEEICKYIQKERKLYTYIETEQN